MCEALSRPLARRHSHFGGGSFAAVRKDRVVRWGFSRQALQFLSGLVGLRLHKIGVYV